MTEEPKVFSTTLILDYKRGTFRSVKRRPTSFKPTEIPISFSLKVNLPKQPELNASGEITLTETKVGEMVMEEI